MNPPDASDEAEIRRMLLSDRDVGFTMLVRSYQPGIYSGARRLTRRHEDAEEVAQETFLRAYRALGSFDEVRIQDLKVAGWLWTIALNLCRDRGSRIPATPVGVVESSDAATELDPIDADEWNSRLGRLSPNQRTAVVLRHIADLSISDIAEAVARPEGTVKADISRGLTRLRESLHREELLQ